MDFTNFASIALVCLQIALIIFLAVAGYWGITEKRRAKENLSALLKDEGMLEEFMQSEKGRELLAKVMQSKADKEENE